MISQCVCMERRKCFYILDMDSSGSYNGCNFSFRREEFQ